MTTKPRIGFIGIGNMGTPMARRLSQQGYPVLIYDVRRAALDALTGDGGGIAAAGDPAEVGTACEVAITMLPDSNSVRDAVLGSNDSVGLAHAMQRGGLVVDMSSSAPTATRVLGAALQDRGIGLVDAPVSGGVPRALDGSLTIMAGGEPDAVAAVEPILACMGTVHRTGPLGAGHAMKALNNYVSAAGLIAVCEALVIAARFGLDPHVLNGVLMASTGRNNTTDRKVEQYMLNRAFDSGFALDLMRKDVATARELAGELALDAPWLSRCADLLDQAAHDLGVGADHTAVLEFLERRLGRHGESHGAKGADL